MVTAYLDLLASTSFAAGANTPRPGPQTVVALRAACRESLDSGLEAHYTVTAALQAASWASAFTLGSWLSIIACRRSQHSSWGCKTAGVALRIR